MIVVALSVLAACQTVPREPSFNAEQVAVLEAESFSRVGDNYELGIDNKVLFGFDEDQLQPETAVMLDRLASVLLGVGIQGAMVEGHTDSSGETSYNQQLSERRATAVKAAMVAAGMPESRVRALGLGETDPVESNDTEEGRQQNRRVVIVVAPADTVVF